MFKDRGRFSVSCLTQDREPSPVFEHRPLSHIERMNIMYMRNKIAAAAVVTGMILTTGVMVSADVRSLPSPALVSVTAGKTFDGKIYGYGWGEEDDPSSLSLEFTVIEPIIYDAAEINSLSAGDVIIAGYDSYTVASVKQEEGTVVVTPEEEWYTPVIFRAGDDGTYVAENEEGVITSDSFSFSGKLAPELVYVNTEGEQLTAAELLKDISGGAIDTDSSVVKITFDENGYIVELDFGE